MTHQKLAVHFVEEDTIAFWNPYLRRQYSLSLPLGNQQAFLRISPVNTSRRFQKITQPITIFSILDNTLVRIIVSKVIINTLLDELISPLHIDNIDNDFLGLLLEMALQPLLSNIRQEYGFDLTLSLEAPNVIDKGQNYIRSQIDMVVNDMNYPIIIQTSRHITRKLLKIFLNAATPTPKTPNFHVNMLVNSAVIRLPLSTIKQLQPHQIVILPSAFHPINQPLGIISDKVSINLEYSQGQLTVKGKPQNAEKLLRIIPHNLQVGNGQK